MNFQNIVKKIGLLAGGAILGFAPVAHAQIYINDSTLSNFTAPITHYATFSNFTNSDTNSVNPPTAASLASGYRFFGGTLTPTGTGITGSNWIEATFPSAVSTIIVFPNIDHLGAAYDGYQYSIAGSNDGVTWTLLFDPKTVNGTAEPFTLGTYTGTEPLIVNNVSTCPLSSTNGSCTNYVGTTGNGPNGSVGYEAFFDFGTAYQYYAFGTSTAASENTDQELSAVGTGPAAITHSLLGNGATNTFDFGFAKYIVVYPAASNVPANTTMTLYANVLSPADCTSAVNISSFSGDEPRCTTFTSTNPGNFSVIFDVACSLHGGSSSSNQCPTTGGFDPLANPPVPHSNLDISNILTYGSTDNLTGYAPQMLTAHEGNDDWVAFGVGFQSDCCTRGSGGSSYNSLVVSADFPSSSTSPSVYAIPPFTFYGFDVPVLNPPFINLAQAGSTIPFKWRLLYPVNASLGFNGGPVTNLNFPPLGYLGFAVTNICLKSSNASLDENLPVDTETNTGLINKGSGYYQFNWKTPKSLDDQCVVVTGNMGDNVPHSVKFLFF